MPPNPEPTLPPHPAVRQSLMMFGAAAFLLLSGASLSSVGEWSTAGYLAALGAGMIWLGVFVRRSGNAAQAMNVALRLGLAGRVAEAEERFALVQARFSIGYIQRTIALNRALLALRRGDLTQAVTFAGEAIHRKVRLISRGNELGNILEARAVRAVALASLGDHPAAEADILAIHASPLQTPTALARAELARALMLEQSGDRAKLGAHLAKHRRLLLEHTHPRERAIVRAFQRMLEAQSVSVYRHGAAREPAPRDEPALSDWVAKLAPGAASFVSVTSAPEVGAPTREQPSASTPAALAAAKARFKPQGTARKGLRLVVLWAALVTMFLAIWQFYSPGRPAADLEGVDPPAAPSTAAATSTLTTTVPVILFVVGVMVVNVWRLRARLRRLRAALVQLAQGEEAAGIAALTALSKGPAAIAGAALHAHASEMNRAGDLGAAETLSERGIAVTLKIPAAAADFQLPTLFAEHAFALAAQGKSAEAAAELALLEERYPAYPLLDTARFRIHLVERARRDDFVGAARVAAQSADLPLTVRDELLADLVRVLGGASAPVESEIARLRKELRADPVGRAWIEKVAPGVARAFDLVGSEAAPKLASRDEEAERELLAMDEALAPARTARSLSER